MTTRRHCFRALLVSLSLFAGANSVVAQYNHAYSAAYMAGLGSVPLSANELDIVRADPGHQCVLGTIDNVTSLFGALPSDHFIHLKKIDLNDNTLWNHSYYFNDAFYTLEPWRVIKTQDEGFIVVGRARDMMATPGTQLLSNPFAFKVDQNGLMQWANIYHSNNTVFYDSIQTSVTRVMDDSLNAESYIITRSGAAASYGEYRKDVAVNALRIDVNGSLIWNKKFRLQSRGYNDSLVKDFPTTITYAPDTAGNFYFIAGANHFIGRGSNSKDSSMFMMGIDKDGNVVRNYQWMHVPAYPRNVDAIYDDNPSENKIVLSYTQANSRLVDSFLTGNRSQIGLMKLDGSLAINMMKYFWSPTMVDNEAARINRNAFDDAYVIAANVKGSGSSSSNFAMLKVDKSGAAQYYQHYNRNKNAKAFGLVTDLDMSIGSEAYSLVGSRASGTSPLSDMKLLSTDASGTTCGSRNLVVIDSYYLDSLVTRHYAPDDTSGSLQINIWEEFPFLNRFDCDNATGDNFRSSQTGAGPVLAANGINVYPTVFTRETNSSTVTIELDNFSNKMPIKAELFSTDGKLISATTFAAQQKVRWTLPEFAPGSYVLHVEQIERKVFKIVKF